MQDQPSPQQLPLKRLAEGIAPSALADPCDQPAELLGCPEQAEGYPDPAQQGIPSTMGPV